MDSTFDSKIIVELENWKEILMIKKCFNVVSSLITNLKTTLLSVFLSLKGLFYAGLLKKSALKV